MSLLISSKHAIEVHAGFEHARIAELGTATAYISVSLHCTIPDGRYLSGDEIVPPARETGCIKLLQRPLPLSSHLSSANQSHG